jgi:hypothetical protein
MSHSKLLYSIAIIMSACISCKGLDSYNAHSREEWFFNDTYSPLDTITIQHYIFCNTQDMESIIFDNNKAVPIDEDSIVQVFTESFIKLDIPFHIKTTAGENKKDDRFCKKRIIQLNRIDENVIREIARKSDGKLVLIPYFYLTNNILFYHTMSRHGVSSNDGFGVISHLQLIVYILKDHEIVYRKHMRYASNEIKTQWGDDAEAIPSGYMVRQAHWDILVSRSMAEYIQRRKKNNKYTPEYWQPNY